MKNIKTLKNIIIGFGILLLSTFSVHAGFGVSPTDISYENLKPGASFTKQFTLSRSGDLQEMNVKVEPDLKEMSDWFTYKPGSTFTFPAGINTITFEVTVNVPSDAPYQNYNGVIRLTAMPTEQEVRGVTIAQGVRLDAGLIVTQNDIRKLSILSIKALDSVLGEPIKLEITGENSGNVDASPVVKVQVMDLQMNVLEENEIANFGFIKPNETNTLTAEFDTNVPTGEYFLNVTVLLDGEELRTERLVIKINNIPEDQQEQKSEEKGITNIISSIKGFVENNWMYMVFIAGAVLVEILVYILLGKAWKNKKNKDKPWAILLGSKKSTRGALALAISFLLFLGLVLYPLIKTEPTYIAEVNNGQTKGVKDVKIYNSIPLTVFPSIQVNQYPIYSEPNRNSKVVYEASEDETFNVIEESNGWYKVSLSDGNIGWLESSIIKSKTIQGE